MRISLCAAISAFLTSFLASGETIRGHVVDEQSNTPVVAAEVRIQKVGAASLLADLDTDGTGTFQGPELPTGDYLIEVSKPNFLTSKLRVHAGGKVTVHLVRYGIITGRVTDQSGQPVPGVTLIPLVTQPGGVMQKSGKGGAVTDARGQFRMFGLPVGRYCVAISYDGPATGIGSNVRLFPNDSNPQVFNITAGEEFSNINLIVAEPKLYRIYGRIEAPLGETGYGATLIARSRPYISVAQLRTERDGKFAFEGIPAGSYDIVVAGPVRGWGARRVFVDSGAFFGRIGVEVSGRDIGDVVIPVAKGRTVAVLLRSSAGVCSGGQISLTALQDQGVWDPAPVQAKVNQPISIPDLPPGRYNINFSSFARDCFQTQSVVVDAATSAEAPTQVTVGTAGSLSGKVTGAAVPSEVEVSILNLSGEINEIMSVVPDEQARFAFEKLPPGRYRVTVHSNQAPKAKVSLDVNLDAAAQLNVDLALPIIEGSKP